MAKTRTKAPDEAPVAAEEPFLPSINPQRLLWVVTAVALVVILAYLHAYPQAPYPLHGIAPLLGLLLLSLAAVMIVARTPGLRPRTLAPVILPCVLVLWALWRTSQARVPTEGAALLGTLLEGSWVFPVALVLAAVGKELVSFSFYEQDVSADREAARPRRAESPTNQSPRLFLDATFVFLLVLAVGMALWAIYEYFILYDQQLFQFSLDLKAAGRSLANLTPHEYNLWEALRAKRVGSRFGNPNVLSGFLAMLVPLAVGAAVLWKDRSAKAAALTVLGVIWYVVLLSGSRGGTLTLLLATGAGALLLGRETIRREGRVLAVATVVCAVAVLLSLASAGWPATPLPKETGQLPLPPKRGSSFFKRLTGSATISQRIYYLESGWEMIRQAPWLGQGLGSYAVLYPPLKQPQARETRYPHNIVCQFWVEIGLVGLLLWVAWIAVVFRAAIGRLRRTRSGPLAMALKMLLVGAAAFLFNNLFEMTWVFREAYLDWCLLLGLMVGLSSTDQAVGEPLEPEIRNSKLERPNPVFRRIVRGSVAMAAVPVVVGVILANSVALLPMLGEAYESQAKEMVEYGQGTNALGEALRLGIKAIRYQPRNPWYHDSLARIYERLGRAAEAREEYQKALRLNPYSAGIRADFAEFEKKKGQPDAARRLLIEAIERYPLNSRYYQLLAELERDTGNIAVARQRNEEALRHVLDLREKVVLERFAKELDSMTSAPR